MVVDGYALNGSVRLHYLDSNPDGGARKTPIVFVPGMLGSAEDYLTEMETLASRRGLAMSLRARGKSDAPKSGYSFEDHVADIRAVVRTANVPDFCLSAYSVGVAYAIGFGVQSPDYLRGLILADYPARYPAFSPGWVERAQQHMDESNRHAAVGIQAEAKEKSLWELLPRIPCPVLVLRGAKQGALLSPEDAAKYERWLDHVTIQVFEDSDHEIWKPDRSRYLGALSSFLEQIDQR